MDTRAMYIVIRIGKRPDRDMPRRAGRPFPDERPSRHRRTALGVIAQKSDILTEPYIGVLRDEQSN